MPAEIADLWLRPRPGTDAAIALAMMHVMIEEGSTTRNSSSSGATASTRLRERVAQFTPERAAALTGVPAEDIVAAARMYAQGPSIFVSGHGIDAFSAGVQTFRAFHCLVAISGNVDRVGGNRRVKKPEGLPRPISRCCTIRNSGCRRRSSADASAPTSYPLWAGPRGWQTACHNPSVIDAILTGKPYPVRAHVCQRRQHRGDLSRHAPHDRGAALARFPVVARTR